MKAFIGAHFDPLNVAVSTQECKNDGLALLSRPNLLINRLRHTYGTESKRPETEGCLQLRFLRTETKQLGAQDEVKSQKLFSSHCYRCKLSGSSCTMRFFCLSLFEVHPFDKDRAMHPFDKDRAMPFWRT